MKSIFPTPLVRAISFSMVRTMTLGQSVYPHIALHISNYYINSNKHFHSSFTFALLQFCFSKILNCSWHFALNLKLTMIWISSIHVYGKKICLVEIYCKGIHIFQMLKWYLFSLIYILFKWSVPHNFMFKFYNI